MFHNGGTDGGSGHKRDSTERRGDAAGPDAIEALFRAHPASDEAIRRYTQAVLAVRESVAFALKLMSKEERYRAFMIFALMTVGRGEGNAVSNGGFTAYCAETAGISRRTAQTTLQLLVFYGFAAMRVDPSDGRGRLYTAQPVLVRFLEGWIGASLIGLRLLGVTALADATPERLRAAITVTGQAAYAGDGYAFFPDPDFRHVFAEIEGGSLVVMAIVLAASDGDPGPSRGELARRFRMSRAQVTRIVAVGRERALFGSGAGGEAIATPRLHGAYRDCILKVMSFLAFHYENGLRGDGMGSKPSRT